MPSAETISHEIKGKLVHPRECGTIAYKSQAMERIDAVVLPEGFKIVIARIERHPQGPAAGTSGPFDSEKLPWPTLAVGDVLRVTLRNDSRRPWKASLAVKSLVVK